jgi:hypothetical protein
MITDLKVIERIKEKLFEEKSDFRTEYTSEFINLEITFMNYYLKVNRILENIISGAFKEDSKGDGYYNKVTAKIRDNDLETLAEIITKYNEKLSNIEDTNLKEALAKSNNQENLNKLKVLCEKDGKMKELSNLDEVEGEDRKRLSVEAEEEILSLYERISVFTEEVFVIIEEMIEA